MSIIIDGTNGISDLDGSASTPAIRGTDANTGIFFPAADTIAFAEGGAEVARFDSSGNLGIGTTSPSTAANGGLTLGTTSAGKSLILNSSSSGNNGLIRFIDSAGSNSAELVGGTSQISIYGYGSRQMTFWTNGTERLTIPSDSAGIKFPATQAASSDANTLDDYEEGTWTPTIRFGGATTGITYSEQIGTYVRIGRIGIISIVITLTNKGSATGDATIANLPFSVTTNARGGQMCATYSNFTNTVYGVGFYASGTTIELVAAQINTSVAMTNSYFQNNTAWRMTGVYIID